VPRDDAPVVLFIHDKAITSNNEQDDADVLYRTQEIGDAVTHVTHCLY
jgi:hypothetical protein